MTAEVGVALAAAFAAGAVLGGLALYVVAFSLRKTSEAELRGQFAALSTEALRGATEQLLALAETRLRAERASVDAAVGGLNERLKAYEELARELEADRARKYGTLEEQLRAAALATERLRSTTDKLQAALSNPRARGQWGERMAEDILRAAGLVENVQYLRNRVQETSATRPDFAFLLPDGHRLHMDVKFPLDNYLRMAEAGSEEERARLRADFLRDARARVRELARRDYVSAEERTLPYVLLFIPNEAVYSFLLESAPGIVDEALGQRVVLASPFSLYAVVAVIRQGFENYHFSKASQEVLRLVGAFAQAYERFKERFGELGERLRKAGAAYDELASTGYKRLDQAVARLEALKKEGRESEDPVPEGDGVPG